MPGPAAATKEKKKNINKIEGISTHAHKLETMYQNAAPTTEQLRENAGELSKEIVSHFHASKKVSNKSAKGRAKNVEKKETRRASAQETFSHVDMTQLMKSQAEATDAAMALENKEDFAKLLSELSKDSMSFLDYKNDENFIKHYEENVQTLAKFQSLRTPLLAMTQEDIDQLNKDHKLKLPSIEALQDIVANAEFTLDFYRAKMDQMRNPFYVVLKDSDTDALKAEDAKQLSEDYKNKGNEKLSQYFDAVFRLKTAAALGAKHAEDGKKRRKHFGNSGKNGKKWYAELFSFKQKFKHIEKDREHIPGVKGGLDSKLVSKDVLKDEEAKKTYMDNVSLKDVGVTFADYSAKVKVAKASIKKKKGIFSFGANASVGAFSVKGSCGAGLDVGLKKKGGWDVNAGAKISASATGAILQGRAKAGLDFGNVKADLKVQGKVLTGTASASGMAGYYTYKDKEGNEHKAFQVGYNAEAQVAIAEATGKFSFSIFGVKITLGGSVQAGAAGASSKAMISSGKAEIGLGAALGLGFKLNIGIDWSGAVKEWKDRKKKKELKEKQRAELAARNEEEKKKRKDAKKLLQKKPAPAPAPAAP